MLLQSANKQSCFITKTKKPAPSAGFFFLKTLSLPKIGREKVGIYKAKMRSLNLKQRAVAMLLHAILSVVFVGLFVLAVFFIWYPNGLVVAGALHGLAILIIVDVVIGPLLTFLVYDLNKKELKYDLAVIVILQLICFVYGAEKIVNERPVYQVLTSSNLELVTASEAKEHEIYKSLSLMHGPKFMILDVSDDPIKNEIAETTHAITSSTPYALQPEKFIQPDKNNRDFFHKRIELTRKHYNKYQISKLNKLKENGLDNKTCKWVTLKSKHISGHFACIMMPSGVISVEE